MNVVTDEFVDSIVNVVKDESVDRILKDECAGKEKSNGKYVVKKESVDEIMNVVKNESAVKEQSFYYKM